MTPIADLFVVLVVQHVCAAHDENAAPLRELEKGIGEGPNSLCEKPQGTAFVSSDTVYVAGPEQKQQRWIVPRSKQAGHITEQRPGTQGHAPGSTSTPEYWARCA